MKEREVPSRNFPSYWLAMSDASAFTIVQSVLAFALDLRRDIAEHVQVVSRLHAAEIAVLLLSAAEGGWGKGKASALVVEIVDVTALSELKAANVYFLVHHALNRLPLTAWPAERLSARQELLDELRAKGHGLHAGMPAHSLKEEERERQWLRAVKAMREPVA
jgi:hypothetical protein